MKRLGSVTSVIFSAVSIASLPVPSWADTATTNSSDVISLQISTGTDSSPSGGASGTTNTTPDNTSTTTTDTSSSGGSGGTTSSSGGAMTSGGYDTSGGPSSGSTEQTSGQTSVQSSGQTSGGTTSTGGQVSSGGQDPIPPSTSGANFTLITGRFRSILPNIQAPRAQSLSFATPGEVQVTGIQQCGNADVSNFYLGTGGSAPHPAVEVIDNDISPPPNAKAVVGMWIVPNPTTANPASQLPIPADPLNPAPGTGQFIPIAYHDLQIFVSGVTDNSFKPQRTMFEVNKPEAIPGPSGTPVPNEVKTGKLMVNNYYELYQRIAPRAYVMPDTVPVGTNTAVSNFNVYATSHSGTNPIAGYNTYTSIMVCKDNYKGTRVVGNSGTSAPEFWEVNEGLIALQDRLKAIGPTPGYDDKGTQITLSSTGGFTNGYNKDLSTDRFKFADPTTATAAPEKNAPSFNGNKLYALGLALEQSAGSTSMPALSSDPLDVKNTLVGRMNASLISDLYNLAHELLTKSKCSQVSKVGTDPGTHETARWFEPFPTQFTCGELDRATDGSFQGFLSEYMNSGLFNPTTGAPSSSVATPADMLKISKMAWAIQSAGIMQEAQNLAHDTWANSAPTLSCIPAAPGSPKYQPYINTMLQAVTIPMANPIQLLNPLDPTSGKRLLTVGNPAPSMHPEGNFAIYSYDNQYAKVDGGNPFTNANQGDSKTVFAMNDNSDGTHINPLPTGGSHAMTFTFAPGIQPGTASTTPPGPPWVLPDYDGSMGLVFNFRIRGVDSSGKGCGISIPYCQADGVPSWQQQDGYDWKLGSDRKFLNFLNTRKPKLVN